MSISEKPKQELQDLAKELKIPGYKKLSKVELVAAIINAKNQSALGEKRTESTFWSRYTNHIYGLASVVGLVIAILAFLPFNSSEVESVSKKLDTTAQEERSVTPANSIAILPFSDMSPDKDQEYFGDGIAEEILNTLTKLTELKVSGRTSSFSFKGTGQTIEEIGQKLNVKYVLEGSVRKANDRIRITAQLIDALTGFHIWSETFDRAYNDIFSIQDELSEKIGSLILGELTPGQIDRITNNSNIDSKAFELFLEAKSIHMHKFYPLRMNKDFIEAEEKFKKAIEIEPNYALAHAGLADLYDTKRYILRTTSDKKYYEDLKIKISKKAMELNPNLPYVQVTQGWVYLDRQIRAIDYEGAFKCFRKAYELDKRNVEGLKGLFWLYDRFDLSEDCIEIMNKMMELSPYESRNYEDLASFYSYMGEFEEVIDVCKRGLLVDDRHVSLYRRMAVAYFFKNEMQAALEAINKVKELSPEFFDGNTHLKIIEAIINNDIDLAERISPNSRTLLYHKKDFDQLDSLLLKGLNSFRANKIRSQQNIHSRLTIHPYYDQLQENPVFKKELEYHILNKEKGSKLLPRAKSFL